MVAKGIISLKGIFSLQGGSLHQVWVGLDRDFFFFGGGGSCGLDKWKTKHPRVLKRPRWEEGMCRDLKPTLELIIHVLLNASPWFGAVSTGLRLYIFGLHATCYII